MFEFEDCKQLVLEILWDGKHLTRFVCELRLTLFVCALKVADTRPVCLMPFPYCFYDRKTNTKDIDSLNKHINSLPRLDDIKVKIIYSERLRILSLAPKQTLVFCKNVH